MKPRPFLIAATLCCLTAVYADNAVRNGSFETFAGNGVPSGWDFRVNQGAAVSISPRTPGRDGEKCLNIVSRLTEKRPNVFGLLAQMVKISPNTDYLLSFSARGKNVNNVTWAIGKGWKLRLPVSEVTEEWNEFALPFRITPEQLEGTDVCGLRLIVEGPGTELDLDDVRLVPKSTQIVTNGTFGGRTGSVPTGWFFRINGNARATMTVDETMASSGKTSLKIVNRTPRNANVYGALSQTVSLSPDIDYVMRVRAKGEGAGVNIAVGQKWLHRLNVTAPTGEWKEYVLEFKLTSDEVDKNGNAPLVIITENVASGIWLDDLVITPRDAWKLPPAAWQKNRVMPILKLSRDFASLREIPADVPMMKLPFSPDNVEGNVPEPGDFSARTAMLYDDDGLILLAEVTDDVARPSLGQNLWQGDSLQLRLDRAGLRRPVAAESDLEVGFSVDDSGNVHSWCWDAGKDPVSGRELPPGFFQAHGFRNGGNYFLAARLNWELLKPVRENGKFGFCIVANDSDRAGHRTVSFLTPGLHDAKYSDQYVQALIDTGKPVFWAAVPETPSVEELTGTLLLTRTEGNVKLSAKLTDSRGKQFERNIVTVQDVKPGELLRVPFTLPLEALAEGECTVDFFANGNKAGAIKTARIDLYKMQGESLDSFCRKLDELKAAATRICGKHPCPAAVAVPLDILERHLSLLRERLRNAADDGEKQFYAELAAMTRQDTADALADLSARIERLNTGNALPQTWKFLTSPVTLENGWPVAMVADENGKTIRRPVVFAGYGHFTDIDRDITRFQNQGANVVQVEIGPRALFPVEGKQTEFEPDFSIVDSRILPLMKKAQENNVKIALLISPHYHPEWLLKKYPELASSSGFLRYEVNHPKAIEMIRAYIPALIGRLKASPYADALHSICLTNEPVYTSCVPDKSFSRSQFTRYMERKYGPVSKFNETAKRSFKNYDEVADAVHSDMAARYEFYSFSRQAFADWHRLLAEEVKKAWPEIPVHAKIMVFSSPFEYVSGIDPELMSEFSNYNGNDNYFYRRGPFIADWNVTAMTHEMQISFKPASIANTENHIIPDRETRPVSNDHIYTALFQQFVTGASTLVTWVWADVDYAAAVANPRGDFIGNIRLRPGNIVAHALAGIDGLRLAPELRKFFDYKPEVAILYSSTSLICSPDAYRSRVDELYTQLCFTGYRVRFLSERQLARGEFGNVKLLYAVGAKYVTHEAYEGLKRFVAAGGTIAADADSLTLDSYGNPAPFRLQTEKAAKPVPAELLAQIHRHAAPLPVSLKGDCSGIFFRAVPDGNREYLVNLVNYNFKPVRLQLEGAGSWFDLLEERNIKPSFILAPLKPQLLRFTPAE